MVGNDTIRALKRYAMGPRPGDAEALDGRVRDWLLAQCDDPSAALISARGAVSTGALQKDFDDYRKLRHKQKIETQQMKAEGASAKADADGMADTDKAAAALLKKVKSLNPSGKAYRKDAELRVIKAVTTTAPFLERLVTFWSDHFCVSTKKGGKVRVIAGAYEREAIRPHVLGSFRDMLGASVRHPAMLLYLDNARSRGPNSRAGLRSGRGLNENHAREILELHTLGVGSGYTQDDVINFAKILTGWTLARSSASNVGLFEFRDSWHEPGSFVLLGKRYGQKGVAMGEAALDDIARHPATARHVARKLVRYFGPGTAMPELEEHLARRFTETDGDLAEVSRELVKSDALWQAPEEKLLSPYEMLIATARALNWKPRGRAILQAMRVLGQPLWAPPSPAGWPDDSDSWLAADALLERLDWAEDIAAQRSYGEDVLGLGRSLFGDALSDYTTQAMARAESRKQAVAILLMSPEFQRR